MRLYSCPHCTSTPTRTEHRQQIQSAAGAAYLPTKSIFFLLIFEAVVFASIISPPKCRRTQRNATTTTKNARKLIRRHGAQGTLYAVYAYNVYCMPAKAEAKTKTERTNTNEFSHFPLILLPKTSIVADDDDCDSVNNQIQNHRRFASDVNLYF